MSWQGRRGDSGAVYAETLSVHGVTPRRQFGTLHHIVVRAAALTWHNLSAYPSNCAEFHSITNPVRRDERFFNLPGTYPVIG